MYRTQVIQHVIDRLNATSYLEIGVCGGKNFRDVKCYFKVGVDPIPPDRKSVKPYLYKNTRYRQMTSDEYFKDYTSQFDVIFIDGLHTKEQAWKDFLNSLTVLNPGGAIIFHDCNPTTEAMQRVPQMQKRWTGDVWKAWVAARSFTTLLMFGNSYCLPEDYGLGVILTHRKPILSDHLLYEDWPTKAWEVLTYDKLNKDRFNYLGIIPDSEFLNILP